MKIKSICSHCAKDYFCKEPCAFLIKLKKDAKEVCKDCVYYNSCKNPCFLAKAFINGNSRPLHELKRNIGPQEIIIVHPERDDKVANFTALTRKDTEFSIDQEIDSSRVEDFWNGIAYQATTLKLAVFVDKFFNKMSFEEIAVKYDISVYNAQKNYQQGKTTLFEVIDDMNNYRDILKKRKIGIANKNKLYKLTNGVKAFLLYHVFDLSNKDVADMLGISEANVGTQLREIRNDVKNNINIIKFDDDFNVVPVTRAEKTKARAAAKTN